MSEMTQDRRMLWSLEAFLMVQGTTEAHRDERLRLYRYLCDTCEHEWSDVSGWGGSPKGTRQCSWCNWVLAPGEDIAPASTEPLPGDTQREKHRAWQQRNTTRVTPPELGDDS